jgi:hypothetical protein
MVLLDLGFLLMKTRDGRIFFEARDFKNRKDAKNALIKIWTTLYERGKRT